MRKILAVLVLSVACGKDSENIIEPKPQCQAQVTPNSPVTVAYGSIVGFGAPNNGHCSTAFLVLDPSGREIAVIGPSGSEVVATMKVSGTYKVKYLADNTIVGSVVVTVIPPPAPKVLFSQAFGDSLMLNTEVRIKYEASNCGSLSSVILPGTPQSADSKTEKIVFLAHDSILKTGSTMPVGKWQQTLLLICAGIDGEKSDTARISFMLKVPRIDADSVFPRTATVGVWGTHCFYSKNRTFVSSNGVDFKGTVSGGSRNGVPDMENMISGPGSFFSPEKFCYGYFPGWNGESVEYIANKERSEGPYPDASVAKEKFLLFTINIKEK
ncbi:MAG: hypothetical protein ACYC5G_02795 [Candidatus Doudnabacteria bacterium]